MRKFTPFSLFFCVLAKDRHYKISCHTFVKTVKKHLHIETMLNS